MENKSVQETKESTAVFQEGADAIKKYLDQHAAHAGSLHNNHKRGLGEIDKSLVIFNSKIFEDNSDLIKGDNDNIWMMYFSANKTVAKIHLIYELQRIESHNPPPNKYLYVDGLVRLVGSKDNRLLLPDNTQIRTAILQNDVVSVLECLFDGTNYIVLYKHNPTMCRICETGIVGYCDECGNEHGFECGKRNEEVFIEQHSNGKFCMHDWKMCGIILYDYLNKYEPKAKRRYENVNKVVKDAAEFGLILASASYISTDEYSLSQIILGSIAILYVTFAMSIYDNSINYVFSEKYMRNLNHLTNHNSFYQRLARSIYDGFSDVCLLFNKHYDAELDEYDSPAGSSKNFEDRKKVITQDIRNLIQDYFAKSMLLNVTLFVWPTLHHKISSISKILIHLMLSMIMSVCIATFLYQIVYFDDSDIARLLSIFAKIFVMIWIVSRVQLLYSDGEMFSFGLLEEETTKNISKYIKPDTKSYIKYTESDKKYVSFLQIINRFT